MNDYCTQYIQTVLNDLMKVTRYKQSVFTTVHIILFLCNPYSFRMQRVLMRVSKNGHLPIRDLFTEIKLIKEP